MLKEGSDYKMQFSVTSDPPMPHYQHVLSKEESSLHDHANHVCLDLQSNIICFKNVQGSDSGRYTISSSNVVGKGQASFLLKVKSECILEAIEDSYYVECLLTQVLPATH